MLALFILALIGCSQAQDWSSSSCGKANYNGKIIGGSETKPNQYPWQTSMQTSWGFHFCGGIIVSSTVVVTAAHCDIRFGEVVVAGEHHLSQNSGTEQQRTVSSATLHPDWNPNTLDYDVAVVRVASAFNLNSAVSPVCKPSADRVSGNAIVSGWGTLSSGASPQVLHAVSVPLITNAQCNSDYGGSITGSMVCAGKRGVGGVDACQGDSGGPLVLNVGGKFELVGDVSWGIGCGLPSYPGVYGRMYLFRSFVDSAL